MYKLPADYHMHSNHSGDSDTPMKDMIESAIKRGLSEICFTEHMDLDFPVTIEVPEGLFTLDIPAYKRDLFSYKEKYKDKITIKYGIELGLQMQITDTNSALIKENDFDFVIGSIHLLDKKDPFYPKAWEGRDEKEVIKRYFESTLENIQAFNDYDCLGHLDYIVRYAPSGAPYYSYNMYKEIIDEILVTLVKNGKGLDLNTKALFRGSKEPNPPADVLKRFYELGGRIITFGADAHTPEGIAGSFDKAREIAMNCGFTEYYTFDKRVPSAIKL